jgi:putative oxidoreductase
MSFLSNYSEGQKNFGLLILRIGIGALFIMHGYPKLIGGPDKWENLGKAMSNIGIDYVPVVWGFMAALTETLGGALLMVGIAFRPVCFLLFFTMVVAATTHVDQGNTVIENIRSASHPIKCAILFFCLLFIGPGNYRMQKLVIE